MSRRIHIDLDKTIIRLLYAYAFLVPFETVLEVFFDVDTIFKPYRVTLLLIIAAFGLKAVRRWTPNGQIRNDIFLYLIFILGLLITAFRMISVPFNMPYFINDAFQISLYLALFLVIRHVSMNARTIRNVFFWLALGASVNGLYAFYNFYILQKFERSNGFMDNPNYFGLSLVVVLLFIVNWRLEISGLRNKVLATIMFIIVAYVLIISGSRTGLFVFIMGVLGNFYFSRLKEKRSLIKIIAVGALLLVIGGYNFLKTTGPLVVFNRIQTSEREDNRIPIWKGVLRASESTYFMGMGIGQFKANFNKFYQDETNELLRRVLQRNYFLSPHSDYLSILVVYGVLGLASYLAFVFASLKELWFRLRLAAGDFNRLHYQFSFLIFLVLTLFGLTHENFFSPLFWVLLSLSTKLAFQERADDTLDDKQLEQND